MTPSLRIGSRLIGEHQPVFIVAELSANHGGSFERAVATVREAARVGADAIKIQTYTPDTLTLKSSAPPFVVKTRNVWEGRTLHDLYAEAMTPWEWHAPLQKVAREEGLAFFSTPFDPSAVAFLAALDVPAYKIASFELVDLPLIEQVARLGKPMILSTGMATLGEIEAAVETARSAGNEELALLRCVSTYPARPEAMNLESLAAMKAFGVVLGLSDHTRDSLVATTAVALGACIVEKHFILERTVDTPDAFFSLEPAEFRDLVQAIRGVEKAIGRTRFGPTPDERRSLSFRRSLFVTRDVPKGATLTCDDVRSVRPHDGLSPEHLPDVLGKVAREALRANEPLRWEMVGGSPSWPSVAVQAEAPAGEARRFSALLDGAAAGQVELTPLTAGTWLARLLEPRSADVGAALLQAIEVSARELGAVRVVGRLPGGSVVALEAFRRAGYYAFVPEQGDVACERRLVPFGARRSE